LSEEEVEKMIQDAKLNEEADKKFHALADSRNKADSLAHSTEKSLKELGDKIQASDRSAIEGLISELKNLIKGDDKEAIDAKTAELSERASQLSQQAYQANAGADHSSGQTEADEKKADDNVVDAEFEEVKEDKDKDK
jgi:molecular chaperone DnaK